jgi:16S rRNA (cytidine1402-2'-O)-methyltransferase
LSRACVAEGVEIQCLPGATAFVPALVNSGLPNDKFVFEGFLPAKKGRQKRLKVLSTEDRTMIFYESPYKILKTLQQFTEHFGSDREVSISREISKIYEETLHGTLEEMIAHFDTKKPKGEFVIVLSGSGVKE